MTRTTTLRRYLSALMLAGMLAGLAPSVYLLAAAEEECRTWSCNWEMWHPWWWTLKCWLPECPVMMLNLDGSCPQQN